MLSTDLSHTLTTSIQLDPTAARISMHVDAIQPVCSAAACPYVTQGSLAVLLLPAVAAGWRSASSRSVSAQHHTLLSCTAQQGNRPHLHSCLQVFPPRAPGSRPPVLLQTLETELLEASNAASRLASAGPHQQRDPKLAANLSLDVHRQVSSTHSYMHHPVHTPLTARQSTNTPAVCCRCFGPLPTALGRRTSRC